MAESEAAICNFALANIGDTAGLIGALTDPTPQGIACNLWYAQTRDELLRSYRWPWATRHAYPAQLGGALWTSTANYGLGALVSYAPARANVVNMPETASTFVYVSLTTNNIGHQPDANPTQWSLLSRAAWAFIFQYPADVIEAHEIYRYTRNPKEEDKIPYELGNDPSLGTLIYTDTGLPWVRDWVGTPPRGIELVYTARVTDPKQFPADFTKALSWALAVNLCTALRKDAAEATRAYKFAASTLVTARTAARREVQPDPQPVPSFILARGTSRR